jgi:lactoylglutathione lyase
MRYAHTCIRVRDPEASVRFYRLDGIEPERPPSAPGGREDVGRICFVCDPDGYRIELIDRDFPIPQDPDQDGR